MQVDILARPSQIRAVRFVVISCIAGLIDLLITVHLISGMFTGVLPAGRTPLPHDSPLRVRM
jgi:hypothetical protein